MISVKNIKYKDIPFVSKDKNFVKCLAYAKSINSDISQYIPISNKESVSFELVNVNSSIANCIRRFLIDELEVYSMHVDEEKVETDDPFILCDYIKKMIELIPICQDHKEEHLDSLHISINIENKTDDLITIYSSDIDIMDKKNKLNNDDYFITTIPIITLRSCKKLHIKDICIVKGSGKINSGKFSLLNHILYEALDVEPLTMSKFAKTGNSSLVSNPTHYKIEFETYRNIKSKTIMPRCCELILHRITTIHDILEELKENTTIHISNTINIKTNGELTLFYFKGEYWTISNLISKYCFTLHNDIEFVCSTIVHPSQEEAIVKIKHSEPIKILKDALLKIIKDFKLIKSYF